MPACGKFNLFVRVFEWVKARVSPDSGLAALSYEDLQFLASDIGVSVADLRAIGPMITDHDEQLKKVMLARGLDPDAVRRAFGGVMRDMEVTCAHCRAAGVCQRALRDSTAAAHCHDFCPNAGVIDELLEVNASARH
nr:hypothetical protein [uncultured Rhodopila sp.]